jgi:hypothetical protein
MFFLLTGLAFIAISILSKKGGRDKKRFLIFGVVLLLAGFIEMITF